ncbi:Protein C24H12.5 b [Aphelenchoides avenae]|nr:Protein C24H12.5 b [Aphelenchus avenae]
MRQKNSSPSKKAASPAWTNPRVGGLRKLVLKRKSSRALVMTEATNSEPSAVMSAPGTSEHVTPTPVKELNPFKVQSPMKRPLMPPPSSSFGELKPINWDDAKENAASPNASTASSSILWDDSTAQSPLDFSMPSSKKSRLDQSIMDAYDVDFSRFSGFTSTPKAGSKKPVAAEKTTSLELPVDMRLGTKLRVVSRKPFSWMGSANKSGKYPVVIPTDDKLKADDWLSTKPFKVDIVSSSLDIPSTSSLSQGALVHATSIYYSSSLNRMWPVFPRMDDRPLLEASAKAKMKSARMLDAQAIDPLMEDWRAGVENLFVRWKRSEIPYFYVCAHTFTALFTRSSKSELSSSDQNFEDTCWSVNGEAPRHRVIITPSSVGLRKILQDDGILFSMPLKPPPKRRSSKNSQAPPSASQISFAQLSLSQDEFQTIDGEVTQSQPPSIVLEPVSADVVQSVMKSPAKTGNTTTDDEFESPCKHDQSVEEDVHSWIKDMGISPRAHIKLRKASSTVSFLGATAADKNKSEKSLTTVLISDPCSIQGFYNILLQCKVGIAKVGPQAGLPPTLLSATSFEAGAGMAAKLTLSSQMTKKAGSETEYVLEMSGGPVLPHLPKLIMEYVAREPALAASDNKVSIQVVGRGDYEGLNEAADPEALTNLHIIEHDFTEHVYSY